MKRHGRGVSAIVFLSFLLPILLQPLPAGAYLRPGETVRLAPANQLVGGRDEGRPSLSATGRYVAVVTAEALIAGDTNNATDVFRIDTKTDRVELVSADPYGLSGTGACIFPGGVPKSGSESPSISSNGRYIAFTSCSANLVAADTNQSWDAFVRDMKTSVTTRVSVSSDGNQQSATIYNYTDGANRLDLSADASTVAFASDAPDLVESDGNATWDVFVHDMAKRTTIRASVNEDGEEGLPPVEGQFPPGSHAPELSGDGSLVAFESDARNFVPGDTNAGGDVFVRDMQRGEIERVSVATGGAEACCTGWRELAMDTSGRYIAFVSCASTLVPNDRNSPPAPLCGGDIFMHDRITDRTERISVSSSGGEGAIGSGWGSVEVSANGRHVVFDSEAENWFDEPSCASEVQPQPSLDVYSFDRHTGALEWESKPSVPASCPSWEDDAAQGTVDGTGRFVAYISEKSFHVQGDATGWDTFLMDRGNDLGVGGLGSARTGYKSEAEHNLCLSSERCLEANRAIVKDDAVSDLSRVLTRGGANLYGASLVYRPQHQDLFTAIELEHMPQVVPGLGSPILYGLRLATDKGDYEVRASSVRDGSFALFDCTDGSTPCFKVFDIEGGYGTTGMRVVFSLPLEQIGLESGGELSDVEAFSALGSYFTGPTRILDTVSLQ